jgi:hypothetical protein
MAFTLTQPYPCLYPAIRLDTRLPLYFIAYCFCYAYTTLMHSGNWCHLDYGESAACVTWVRGG